jgi:Flp pilus assembly protein TadG
MRVGSFCPPVGSPRRRGWKHGQGLVEFMIVAPVFFFVIFAMIDGGLLLYSVNAVDQSTTVGSNSIAGLGLASNADIGSLQKMSTAGLQTTSLVKITEIDVEELVTNATSDGFSTHADGTPVIQTGCAGGPTGVDGANECVNRYTFSGSTVVVMNAWSSCASSTNDPSQCPPWPPSVRDVVNGNSSFVGLKVAYSYHFFTDVGGTFNLTATKTFRLEPETNAS